MIPYAEISQSRFLRRVTTGLICMRQHALLIIVGDGLVFPRRNSPQRGDPVDIRLLSDLCVLRHQPDRLKIGFKRSARYNAEENGMIVVDQDGGEEIENRCGL